MTGGLERYFRGDDAWRKFVEVLEPEWTACSFKAELTRAVAGHEDIAKVVFATFDENSLQWLHEPVPSLNGTLPLECLASDSGLKRLKTALMRMPR